MVFIWSPTQVVMVLVRMASSKQFPRNGGTGHWAKMYWAIDETYGERS